MIIRSPRTEDRIHPNRLKLAKEQQIALLILHCVVATILSWPVYLHGDGPYGPGRSLTVIAGALWGVAGLWWFRRRWAQLKTIQPDPDALDPLAPIPTSHVGAVDTELRRACAHCLALLRGAETQCWSCSRPLGYADIIRVEKHESAVMRDRERQGVYVATEEEQASVMKEFGQKQLEKARAENSEAVGAAVGSLFIAVAAIAWLAVVLFVVLGAAGLLYFGIRQIL